MNGQDTVKLKYMALERVKKKKTMVEGKDRWGEKSLVVTVKYKTF